jgi:hypothetical protein
MLLSKEQIISGLKNLDAKARSAEIMIDIAIYGGASLALAFDMRQATRDVDAVVKGDRSFVRQAVKEISQENNWPADWLNEGVKGFISDKERLVLMQDFQGSHKGGLRIYVPTPEYLLAMKCMAMRIDDPDAAHDVTDIKNLAKLLKIDKAEQFFAVIEGFYPASRISAKTTFGVEEIAQKLKSEAELARLSLLPKDERMALVFIMQWYDLTKPTREFDNFGTTRFRSALEKIAVLKKTEDKLTFEAVEKLLVHDAPWSTEEAKFVSTNLARHPGAPRAVAEQADQSISEIEKAQERGR